ncbi:sirohydrochlorin chelatase [Phycicoccus endophyticus]|uniref:Sirohydrochlorin chelatase n=1 Tax=Phycicoccus endophyticus TaxID=1690220 RepID=A0A7G9R3Q7_9MICO|nr:CbiX/SirB N-terminal domain-containing protein [Phycicoccus endophyticus]NHI18054.1 sirohydrochlorin chelatase [Phycicoccus endophyticus]QNN50232.1 sirohydrochlorin chelatase [Phycicoccus endophyticus]GGL26771.1 cobalamin biosynthesis protein CbiX [Phycicoccus endophyticus]
MGPVLVLCAHGTRDPHGRATVADAVAAVAAAAPETEVREAYVDVHGPRVEDVVAALPTAASGPAGVVVPLLLAAGYHVRVDLAAAVAGRPDVLLAPALGPDERLVGVLADRLARRLRPGDAVVLAPAGSSDPRAQADSEQTARMLGARLGTAVGVGYAAGPSPSAARAVADARAAGARRVLLASYLLAPGFFQGRLEQAGADVVTGPLLPEPRVVQLVLDRYRATGSAPAEGA